MKLAPTNQTFIPAANSGNQRFAVSSLDEASSQLGQALRTAVGGAQIKSVTIVASRSDDHMVVVRAQYAPERNSPHAGASAASNWIVGAQAPNRGSSYLSPIQQYARTQTADFRSAPLLDVRA